MGVFAHAQTVDTRPLFPPTTWPGYELGYSEYKCHTLRSSITTPKDAHKRLVLQVYLGSNTSRLEFSTIKTLPSREELDISLSIVNSKACFYTHALHALLAWSALARCLLLHGCEIKSGSCLGTRLPLFLDCWWTKVSFLHHGTKPICTQIWDPIWPVY